MNLIFWLFVTCALAVLAGPFLLIIIIGMWRRSRRLIWLGAIPGGFFLGLAALALFILVISIVHPYSETTNGAAIRKSFVYNFDFQPGTDFIPMNQKVVEVGDSGRMYLKFKVSAATFEQIRTNNFQPLNGWEFLSYTGGPNAPAWWPQPNQSGGVFYHSDPWKGPFHGNRAYLSYQSESNIVYFCSVGSD